MKKHILLLITVLGISFGAKAQLTSGSYSDYFREGSFLLLEEDYKQALANFLTAYKIDSTSANINFNVGFCIMNSSVDKEPAEYYLAKAVTNVVKNYRQDEPAEKGAPPLAHFYYARALHNNYKFDEAAAQYGIFETKYAKDKQTKENVAHYKQQTQYAKELISAPINVKIENLGDSINSEYPEFSPLLSADERTLIYTTRRNTSTGGEKTPNGEYYEDIVISYKDNNGKWSSPKSISSNLNTNGHDAAVSLTIDGQTLILFKGISEKDGNIYFSNWDGSDWTPIQQFGSDINSKYWESHACLSADNNTLYFVSDRPGGFGGRDIYRCIKLPNGNWSKALNLGPTINTKYDEDGPFIHPDGVTLMFASSGHKSMGGFDIFFATIEEDKKFSEVVNMGYPINTTEDDIFFVTSPDGKRGYFSSSKDGGFGDKDIYTMYIPDAKEKPLALFKGSIIAASGEKLPEELMVIVRDSETGEIIGTYRPKSNGTFSTILPPNKNYNFSYQSKGEEFYNEDLYVTNDITYQEIKKEINLEPVNLLGKVKVKDKTVTLNTLVFNNPTDKKPVSNAKVILTQVNGANSIYNVDEKGRKEGTSLTFDKEYSLVAEVDGKQSLVNTFNTKGIKGSKSITQMLYFEGKPVKDIIDSKKETALLNLLVKNSKNKPLPNANVTINGDDGSKYEGITDAQGTLKNIRLNKDVNYDLVAEKNGNTSDNIVFNAKNASSKKPFAKTITVNTNGSAIVNNNTNTENNATNFACGEPTIFKQLFAYDKNETNEAKEWKDLIDGITTKIKDCATISVKILSSASTVPTRSYKDNRSLAQSRAENTEAKIKATLKANGVDVSKVVFTLVYQVRGPRYEADYLDKEKYEKYQYVKVIAR